MCRNTTEFQPGEFLRQDVPAGLALPNRYQATEETPAMIGAAAPPAPPTTPHDGVTGTAVGPLVMTLCGSMRFYRLMLAVAAELTTDGVIVLAPFLAVTPAAQTGTRAEIKARLDRLHRDKIDRSHAVLVVSDHGGYYGDSTAAEITYAETVGLPVFYRRLSEHDADALVTDLSGADAIGGGR